MTKVINFTKMHGLGNDFMVIDAVRQHIELTPALIKQFADRHRGIGFDQLLLVEVPKHADVDFNYRIFNADGSESYQCGNGARCLAKFIRDTNLSTKTCIRVETGANIHDLLIADDGVVSVDMQPPELEPVKIPFIADKEALTYDILLLNQAKKINISAISMGNPHCVLVVNDFDEEEVQKIGHALSHHPRFPEQANVGFMQIISSDEINLRVYERGAGETLACGSGACAAVVAGRLLNKLAENVVVNMLGGQLKVRWPGIGQSVWLSGPAVKVFDGMIDISILL
jgi:diaminopimelate epimerase